MKFTNAFPTLYNVIETVILEFFCASHSFTDLWIRMFGSAAVSDLTKYKKKSTQEMIKAEVVNFIFVCFRGDFFDFFSLGPKLPCSVVVLDLTHPAASGTENRHSATSELFVTHFLGPLLDLSKNN